MALTLLDCQIRICSIADRYLLVADLIDPPRRKRGARPRSRGDPWGTGHRRADHDSGIALLAAGTAVDGMERRSMRA